jgi:hypothetical protein
MAKYSLPPPTLRLPQELANARRGTKVSTPSLRDLISPFVIPPIPACTASLCANGKPLKSNAGTPNKFPQSMWGPSSEPPVEPAQLKRLKARPMHETLTFP